MDEIPDEEVETEVLSFQSVAEEGAKLENGDEIYQHNAESVEPDDLATGFAEFERLKMCWTKSSALKPMR